MDAANIAVLHQFVDENLQNIKAHDMMRLPHPNMAEEMRDHAQAPDDDWLPWQPITSTVTDADIIELESKIKLPYPKLYTQFLKYKHFYELWPVEKIIFFRTRSPRVEARAPG